MSFSLSNLLHALTCFAFLCVAAPSAPAMWQGEDDPKPKATEAEADSADDQAVSTDSLKTEAPEIDPQFLRFEMWDGTVVSGIVSIPAIDVETEFGDLKIPIERLVDFRPGLVSLPELRSKVELLVEQLGDREFRTREAAHRELVGMGPMLMQMFSDLDDGGDAERKKHLTKIKEEVQSMMDEQEEEDGSPVDSGVSNGDRIQTPEFAIVGKIVQEEFQVKSKIGDLRILLADLSTKIRVSKGDKITISASGIVQWTNWSQTASPDGLPNQGNWNGLSNGSLAARIGADGKVIGVGSDNKFTAEKSGILYLGIAMPDNYVNNTGYRWTGKFKAKVKVEPGG